MSFFWPLWTFFDWLRHRHDRATLRPEHALGHQGESLAHRYLQRKGYRVVGRQWRTWMGLREVDIIAWDRDRLVFVEVKSRRHDRDAAPARNISEVKRIGLRAAAREYCRDLRVPLLQARVDYIEIVFEPRLRIDHDIDALSLFDR